MPVHGAALSLMLRKGSDRRREDELWKAFTEADQNKDGYLSVEEYVQVFHNHGIAISQEEVMLFFNSKDRDRDGRISYEEFCDRETVNERAFKAMDLNRDGFVTKSEMLKASNRGARKLSATDVEACFKEFDRDGDNKLSYDEFCVMMNTRKHSLELLLEHHQTGTGSTSPTSGLAASTSGYHTGSNPDDDGEDEDNQSVVTVETTVE